MVTRLDIGNPLIDYLAFADSGHLVVGDTSSRAFQVWDLGAGRPSATVRVPLRLNRDTLAIAPGGKSMAVAASIGGNVGVFSLETGALLAEGLAPPFGPGGIVVSLGLSYSPDGAEVAAIFNSGQAARVMAWGLPGGKVVADCVITAGPVDITAVPPSYEGPALGYLPGVDGWLIFGKVVHDRLGGRSAGTVQVPADELTGFPRRLQAPDRILYVVGRPGHPTALHSNRLPADAIARAVRELPALPGPATRPGTKPARKP